MADISLPAYRSAYREITVQDNRRGFLVHLGVYLGMNTLLVTINVLTDPESLWCLGALIGWGTGVAAHYITAVATIRRKLNAMEAEAETLAKARCRNE